MKLDVESIGFGLIAAQNNEVALVGGMRSGNSGPGETRAKFMIYDTQEMDALINKGMQPQDAQKESESGFVELYLKDGDKFDVSALVNIEVDKDKQGKGLGTKVVQSLIDSKEGSLDIIDIQPTSFPFWNKMGVDNWSTRRDGDNIGMVDAHKKRNSSTIFGQIPEVHQIDSSTEARQESKLSETSFDT